MDTFVIASITFVLGLFIGMLLRRKFLEEPLFSEPKDSGFRLEVLKAEGKDTGARILVPRAGGRIKTATRKPKTKKLGANP